MITRKVLEDEVKNSGIWLNIIRVDSFSVRVICGSPKTLLKVNLLYLKYIDPTYGIMNHEFSFFFFL